jgi:hypothetical protein
MIGYGLSGGRRLFTALRIRRFYYGICLGCRICWGFVRSVIAGRESVMVGLFVRTYNNAGFSGCLLETVVDNRGLVLTDSAGAS